MTNINKGGDGWLVVAGNPRQILIPHKGVKIVCILHVLISNNSEYFLLCIHRGICILPTRGSIGPEFIF